MHSICRGTERKSSSLPRVDGLLLTLFIRSSVGVRLAYRFLLAVRQMFKQTKKLDVYQDREREREKKKMSTPETNTNLAVTFRHSSVKDSSNREEKERSRLHHQRGKYVCVCMSYIEMESDGQRTHNRTETLRGKKKMSSHVNTHARARSLEHTTR